MLHDENNKVKTEGREGEGKGKGEEKKEKIIFEQAFFFRRFHCD